MKKRDIKYIIKRVVIGVLIVLIVGSINKCNVYAVQLNSVNFNVSAHGSGSCPSWYQVNYSCGIESTIYSDTNIFGTYPVDFRVYSESRFSHPNTRYAKFKITNSDNSNTIFANFVFYNKTNQDLILDSVNLEPVYRNGVFANLFILNSVSHVNGSSDSIESSNNWGYYLYVYSNSNYDENVFLSSYFNNYLSTITINTTVPTNENILYLYHGAQDTMSNNLFPIENFFTDWEIYDSNLDLFYYDGTEIFPNLTLVPSYYQEINLQDHPGVYFVPKNYSTVPTIQNSINETVIPFNFYYKGNFAEGYFPLNNYKQIVFLPNSLLNRENISYNSSWFPLQQVIDDTTYDYYAYIFENNDYATFSQHEDSLIYYDSRYFDYYLIDDFYNYYQPIDIINKENQQEQINVTITTSLNSLFKAGSQTQGTKYIGESISDALQDVQIIKYLDFIKIPFNFLNNIMTSSTCSPIEIPIPFVGGNLTLPCISSLFNEKIPQIYTILVIVVNGLFVYRITIRNIDTLTDSLSSDDDKLEVVDL